MANFDTTAKREIERSKAVRMPARKTDGRQDVGLKLREAREARGLSLTEIERAIKIHAQHLQALEAGDYEGLPDVSWGRGFLVTYATYLRLDGEQLANDLFPLRRPFRPRLYLRHRWRALLAVLGALGVALAFAVAMLAASYEPFADTFTGRVDDLLERLVPGLVLGYEPQPPFMTGVGQDPSTDQARVDFVPDETEASPGGTQAPQPIDRATSLQQPSTPATFRE